MKDNFSRQSKLYSKFRPGYPPELYEFIFSHVKNYQSAWDCGTGNGQVATVLAKKFKSVVASDISEQQLSQAPATENVTYVKAAGQLSDLPGSHFDLITVAQAIHWFDFETFYKEVDRVGKQGSLLAVWGYSLLSVNDEIDPFIKDFYENKIGFYWDPERKMLDERYRHIPFPFTEIASPDFQIESNWSLQQMEGYLNTWSSVQKYITVNNENPVDEVIDALRTLWKDKTLSVRFPVFLRLGKVS